MWFGHWQCVLQSICEIRLDLVDQRLLQLFTSVMCWSLKAVTGRGQGMGQCKVTSHCSTALRPSRLLQSCLMTLYDQKTRLATYCSLLRVEIYNILQQLRIKEIFYIYYLQIRIYWERGGERVYTPTSAERKAVYPVSWSLPRATFSLVCTAVFHDATMDGRRVNSLIPCWGSEVV